MTTRAMQEMYGKLIWDDRIQKEFRVALVDRTVRETHSDIWQEYCKVYLARLRAVNEVAPSSDFDAYMRQYRGRRTDNEAPNLDDMPCETPSLGKVKVKLPHLVWDGDVMVFSVQLEPWRDSEVNLSFDRVPPHVKQYCYMVFGTASASIGGKNVVDLLKRWRDSGANLTDGGSEAAADSSGIWAIEVDATLDGDIRPVLLASYTATIGIHVQRQSLNCYLLISPELPMPPPSEPAPEVSPQPSSKTSIVKSMLNAFRQCVHTRKLEAVD